MKRYRYRLGRFVAFAVLLAGMLLLSTACKSKGKRPTPLPEGVEPNDIIDVNSVSEPSDPLGPLEANEITKVFLARRAEAKQFHGSRFVRV